jgi:hypothetical protein
MFVRALLCHLQRPVLDQLENPIGHVSVGLFRYPSGTFYSVEGQEVILLIHADGAIDGCLSVEEFGICLVEMNQFFGASIAVLGALADSIAKLAFELDPFLSEGLPIGHLQQSRGYSLERLAQYEAVADKDFGDADTIVGLQSSQKPTLGDVK